MKNDSTATMLRAWFEPVVKVASMLILAGVLFARQEARFTQVELKLQNTAPQMEKLEKSLTSLRDEVIKLRIELAETRAVQAERGKR
ncbi:MAG: hypothetical protein ABFD89_24445 [Bryobacteraceae bacterium]